MKRIAIIIFIILSSCSTKTTPEQKAFDAIKQYMKNNLNDSNGYEPGEFSIMKTDASGWDIDHAFRAKNGFNATIPGEWEFHVDQNFNVEKVKEWR